MDGSTPSDPSDASPADQTRHAGGPAPTSPDHIGRYRLLRVLGEGGMGIVYLAEQTEPIRRRVAVKVVKLGMDTREVLARFESERQALAVMEHANIARVFEAGTTKRGRPYFAMELVDGEPITDYCDRHRLTTRERVELFLPVCEAVQHAHQKGVVHRDLKPSNILVTVGDRGPIPKVIDFGIAKAVGRDLTDRTMVTRAGQLLGTPAYMSPEQAEGSGLDVDTRTDVYALGAVLYELLSGTPPLAVGGVPDWALARAVRDPDPPTPSSRVTTLGDEAAEVARRRRSDPESLRRELAGDLDWIVMRAIEKDRTRRFGTATALEEDLRRFLGREPVLARPPSRAYLARRFVQRHRVGVTAALIVVLALVTGAAVAAVGLVRAREAERRAQVEARSARAAADFLVQLFTAANPYASDGRELTATELLDRGRERFATGLQDDPLVRRRVAATMGQAYTYLGRPDLAVPLFREGLALAREHLRDDPLEVAVSLQHLAIAHLRSGELDRAVERAEEAVALLERAPSADGALRTQALLLSTLGGVHSDRGRWEAAASAFRRGLAVLDEMAEPDERAYAVTHNNLGVVLMGLGRYEDAESHLRRALEIHEALADPNTTWASGPLLNLGVIALEQGEYDAAERLLRRSLRIKEDALGSAHPEVADVLHNLADLSARRGEVESAGELYRRALDIYSSALGTDHPESAETLLALGNLRWEAGEAETAERWYGRAVTATAEAPAAHMTTRGLAIIGLARIARARDDQARADSLYRAGLGDLERGSSDPSDVRDALSEYAEFSREAGLARQADSLEARAGRRDATGSA